MPIGRRELNTLQEATEFAKQQGLHVHMGHGLNYENVAGRCADPRRRGVEHRAQHRVRAVLVGMERAVREMKDAIEVQ